VKREICDAEDAIMKQRHFWKTGDRGAQKRSQKGSAGHTFPTERFILMAASASSRRFRRVSFSIVASINRPVPVALLRNRTFKASNSSASDFPDGFGKDVLPLSLIT
jgi:hypothetical protein